MEDKVKFYQKMYEAHDSNYSENNDVQDLKESYYYRGRRDEAAEYDTLVKERELLIEALKPLANMAGEVFKDTNQNKQGVLYGFNKAEITYADLRKAKELLNNLQIKTT